MGHVAMLDSAVSNMDLLFYLLKVVLMFVVIGAAVVSMHIGRAAVYWPFFAALSGVASLIAFPVVPVVVLLWMLPKPFAWLQKPFDWLLWPFMTYDNPIDGDGGHLERWPGPKNAGRNTLRDRFHRWLYSYCRRVGWLWRNRVYNISYYCFGRTLVGVLTTKGNGKVSDRPFTPGMSFQYDERGAWELYAVWKIPYLPLCVRHRVGWSIPEDYRSGMVHRCMLKTHYISIRSTNLS